MIAPNHAKQGSQRNFIMGRQTIIIMQATMGGQPFYNRASTTEGPEGLKQRVAVATESQGEGGPRKAKSLN